MIYCMGCGVTAVWKIVSNTYVELNHKLERQAKDTECLIVTRYTMHDAPRTHHRPDLMHKMPTSMPFCTAFKQ